MSLTNQIIIIAWLPQAIIQVLVWTYWWQVKEYRFDRFRVLVKSKSGSKKLFINYIALKILAFAISPNASIPILVLTVIDGLLLIKLYKKNISRPVFTERVKKMLAITGFGVFVVFVLASVGVYRFELSLLIAEIFILISPALGILWTKPLVEKARRQEMKKAEKKLSKINPKVIGITGSYGKSTTKDFLAHLLSKKYKVEKTTKNQNNEFGIARKILNDFSSSTEIFVAEMGAYTIGEIANITSFTHPKVGIITGLDPQHLDLFGSFENVKKAKFELIENLPPNGLAVFNSSNDDCEKLAQKAKLLETKLRVKRYKLVSKFKKNIDAQSRIIKQEERGITFEIMIDGEEEKLFTHLTGEHFVENLTGAILVARVMKVSWSEIRTLCKNLSTPEGTMSTNILNDGTLIIDDTYNSTPKGFIAALNFLSNFTKKHKVVVTSGIIELGSYSHIIHKDLGELMADKVDLVILVNPDFADDLSSGLGSHKDKLVLAPDADYLINLLKDVDSKETAILMEGRLPRKVVEYINSQK